MAIKEQAVLELIAEFQKANAEVADLQRRYLAVMARMEKATDEVDLADLEREAKELASQMNRVGREGQRALGDLVRGGNLADDELRDVIRRARQLDDALEEVNRESHRLGHEGRAGISGLGASVGKLRAAFAAVGAAVAAIGLVRIAREAVETAAKFEQLRVQLRTVEGDAGKAAAAFDTILRFAVKTPFEVENLVEAWIRLRAVGIRPTADLMKDFGEIAAANGKDITQIAEAVVGAVTGETERLKQFGIIARIQGERIRFTFRGVTTELARDADSIVGYLRSIGQTDFAGGMAEQANTVKGALSNLNDIVASIADSIGKAGLNEALATATKELTAFLGENQDLVRLLAGPVIDSITTVTTALRILGRVVDFLRDPARGLHRAWAEATGAADPFADAVGNLTERLQSLSKAIDEGRLTDASRGLVALVGDLQIEGKLTGEVLDQVLAQLDRIIESLREQGRSVAPLEALRDRLREQAGAASDAAAAYEEAALKLEQYRAKEEEAKKAIVGSREELVERTRVLVAAVSEILQAGIQTEQQGEAVKQAIRELLDAWATYGEEAPASLLAVAQQLGVNTTVAEEHAEKSIAAIKKLATEQEQAAKRQRAALESVADTLRRLEEQVDRLNQRNAGSKLSDDLKELQERRAELQDKPLLSQDEVKELDQVEEKIREVEGAIRDASSAQKTLGEDSEETAKVVDQAVRSLVGSLSGLYDKLGAEQRVAVQNILEGLQSLGQQGQATGDDVAAALAQLTGVFESAGIDAAPLRTALREIQTGAFDVGGALEQLGKEAESGGDGLRSYQREAEQVASQLKKLVTEVEKHSEQVKETFKVVVGEVERSLPVWDAYIKRLERINELCREHLQCIQQGAATL